MYFNWVFWFVRLSYLVWVLWYSCNTLLWIFTSLQRSLWLYELGHGGQEGTKSGYLDRMAVVCRPINAAPLHHVGNIFPFVSGHGSVTAKWTTEGISRYIITIICSSHFWSISILLFCIRYMCRNIVKFLTVKKTAKLSVNLKCFCRLKMFTNP